MENKELVKKSDVGPKSSYDLIVKTNKLIKDNYDYNSLTGLIQEDIESIFDNYLSIGQQLNEIKSRKLYLVNDYKTVYEYSTKEFELSSTTTKNIIAISNRFCDEHGSILEEYEGFTFSNLVELLSVKESDVKSFVPGMTVKAVRSKKLELDVNKKIDELFSLKGFLTELINTVLLFDWSSKLNIKTFEITHEVIKEKYTSVIETERYYNDHGSYSLSINFKIKHKDVEVVFALKIDLNRFSMQFTSVSNCHVWLNVSNPENINTDLMYIAASIKDKFAVEDKNNEHESNAATSPGYSKLKKLDESWNKGSYTSLLKYFIANLQNDYFYEQSKSDCITVYASGKRHKKKNPPLYEIKHMNDPRKTSIVNHLKESIEFKLFDDFDEYFNKHVSKIKETII